MSASVISTLANKRLSLIVFFRRFFAFPRWQDALLSVLSAILLILAFPDFELWFAAWFGLVPIFIAVERNKDSTAKCFWLGLLGGTVFFYGSCWWLTYAPINYGGIPTPIVFFLLFPATLGAGFFIGIFCSIFGHLVSKFGHFAIFLVPLIWTACEFLRLLITGNAWNALGYSQAFQTNFISTAQYGGVFIVGFLIVLVNTVITNLLLRFTRTAFIILGLLLFGIYGFYNSAELRKYSKHALRDHVEVIAIQPNVPMSGLMLEDYYKLRQRHIEMTETALREIDNSEFGRTKPIIVVFPESPMNFAYAEDSEFREFLQGFASRNKISLIFNAGEPDVASGGYHNSAVMVNERGEKIAQYDKIRLVPFGEFVPEWLPGNEFLPTVVGRMKPGKDFRLMPFGSAVRAGVMICYESAFGDISSSFVRNGADALVEITNDGYGGNTPILRQHLANAVFRAVETNRPVLRVTNVGITAYINERGEISDQSKTYETATRIWTVEKSDGEETFYVRHGDLFAWICLSLTAIFLGLTFFNFGKIDNR
jgi:apolipoprotein N-acyltransferase